jgi:hypothetical protein
MLEMALSYANRGKAVFPLLPRSKTPATPNGFKDATTNADAIRDWWHTAADYNIGLPTGAVNDLVVLDIDPRNGGTDEGLELPETTIVETSGGGKHYYFRGSCRTAHGIRKGVDLQGAGGYVVAPPSLHPGGEVYRFVSKTPPAAIPSWLTAPPGGRVAVLASAISAPITEGSRNATLASMAGSMRRRGFSPKAILQALLEENGRCVPQLTEREVTAIAHSIGRYEPARLIGKTRAVDVKEEDVVWIWTGRIPAAKLTILEGDPGLGKSTVAGAVAAFVTGADTASQQLPGAGAVRSSSVLIASAEDGLADTLVPRLRAAGARLGKISFLEGIDLGRTDHLFALRREIEADKAALVVIDPLMAYLSGVDSYRDQDVRRVLGQLADVAGATGAGVLMIRHRRKADGPAIYSGGGSIGIAAAARSVLLLAKNPRAEGEMVLASVKLNIGRPAPSLRLRLIGREQPVVEWLGETDVAADVLVERRNDGGPIAR